MAFATIQITQGAIIGGNGESVIGLASGTNVTLTDAGGAGATSYLWEVLAFPAPNAAAPTVNNSTTQVATVVAGAGFTDGVYIVRLTRTDPGDGISTQVRFFAVADADGLSLPVAGMNRNMTNVLGSSAAQAAGWFGSVVGGTNVFLDAFLRLRRAREGKSKVSANDTTFGNLEDKLTAGSGISLQVLNDGGNEAVEISASGGGAGAEAQLVTDAFTATAAQTVFTLSQAPGNDKAMMSVNGVVQKQADYAVSGTGVTYSGIALLTGDAVEFWYVANYAETVISPAPGTTENNYAPTGWSSATIVRLNPSGVSSITGFSASATAVRKTLINVSANDITLAHQDAGSSTTNRIIAITGGLVLEPDDVADLWYDNTTARWRVV